MTAIHVKMWPEVVVVSTAYRPKYAHRVNCETSVQAQTVAVRHVYIDAAEPGKHGECSLHLHREIGKLDPATIVVWLDGDDWLAHDRAVERVLQQYARGAWCTWGQFQHADGAPGWAQPRDVMVPARRQPWFATHLKTFRAGLFQRIHAQDLQTARGMIHSDRLQVDSFEWLTRAVDLAVMYPIVEMAAERGHFIPEVLCIYSGENTPPEGVREGWREADRVRNMQSYDRLEVQPW